MSIAGTDPFGAVGDGRVGALVLHGFTGSPHSVRPWAQALADAGLSVEVPLLPGHGTRWQDMVPTRWPDWYGAAEAAFVSLRRRCNTVFVCGLSMGGTLALRLAEQRDDVAGVLLVNAALGTDRWDAKLLPLAQLVIPSFPGITDDIAAPGVRELGYDRLPLKPAYSLAKAWKVVRGDLAEVTAPMLVFRSATDHVVPAVSGRWLLAGATSSDVREVVLPDSYHVATLDHDAPTIFAESVAFIRGHVARGVGVGPGSGGRP